jgi:hypothetical protein
VGGVRIRDEPLGVVKRLWYFITVDPSSRVFFHRTCSFPVLHHLLLLVPVAQTSGICEAGIQRAISHRDAAGNWNQLC